MTKLLATSPGDSEEESASEHSHSGGHIRLLSTMLMLSICTFLAKCVALGKDLLVAKQLGAGDALDAYFVALVVPSYAVVVLAHTFALAFVPTYMRVLQRDGLPAALKLAGGVLWFALGMLTVVTALLCALAPVLLPLVGNGFDSAKLELTQSLFYWMVGIVLTTGVTAVLAAILNAHGRFVATAITPLTLPLGALLIFGLFGREYGVRALAAGTLLGFIAETLVLVVAAWHAKLIPRGRWNRHDPEVRRVGRQYLPVAVGGLLMSSSLLVDQSMAASLGSGQVSILNYGSKVVAVVLGVVGVSVSNVLFPRFAHLIAIGRSRELERTFGLYTMGIFLAAIPAVSILAYFTQPIVSLLFERGAFTPETTVEVSRVQLWLLPQIPFYVMSLLGARVLSALDGNSTVLRIAAINLVVNVLGNYLLMRWMGVAGIALATSLVYVVSTVTTLAAIRTKLAAEQPQALG